MQRVSGTYDYARLDDSGEGGRAAARMEARAVEPASEAMFDALVRPLLAPEPRCVLEIGAGTGALARRVAAATERTQLVVTDKSRVMLGAAEGHARGAPGLDRTTFVPWDVAHELPREARGPFDLVLSSVMVPYLDDDTLRRLVATVADALERGGKVVFLEQDLQTASLHHAPYAEVRALFVRGSDAPFLPLRLRGFLREAGLVPLPRTSFLWTSERFGPYLRDLLERAAKEAVDEERLPEERGDAIAAELEDADRRGDFYYGLVYHAIGATKP